MTPHDGYQEPDSCREATHLGEPADVSRRQLAELASPGVLDKHPPAAETQSATATPVASPSLFLTARQLSQLVPPEPDWIIEGYPAKQAITELTAKIKTGKTHFALDAISAVLNRSPFLGRSTDAAPVVYLTEERWATFHQALGRVGLASHDDLHILHRHKTSGMQWSDICWRTTDRAREVGAGLVVVDTLPDWASLAGDSENDAGAALDAMRPLQQMAAEGLAVLVCRHERKSGGTLGDSARGSSAFGGAADIIVTLQRLPGQGHPNRRAVKAVGRFDATPPRLIVEMSEGRYEALGTDSDVEFREVRKRVVEMLPSDKEEAITLDDIVKKLSGAGSRPTAQRALKGLIDEGMAAREKGAGAATPRAHGYWLVA